jgi:hypothetical protein
MLTITEIQEKLDHLATVKKEITLHFEVISLSKQKHAVLAAYYATIDNEIALLRWVLGEQEQTWSDDLSGHIDMEMYSDAQPATTFPRKPHPQEIVAQSRLQA